MAAQTASSAPGRLVSLDAYRGFVMFLMMAEVLHLCSVADQLPGSAFWGFLCNQQSHVEWVGCVLHDLIQPSFSFMVGVALAFSVANRKARGQSTALLTLHAFWRALVLVLLGVFLRSLGSGQTNWTFEDTLTQIGMGYGFLFLVGLRPVREQWVVLGLILVGYWLAFVMYPLPGAGFNWDAAGVSPDWEHNLKGLAAHWNKNTNLAWAVDNWFMNLWPRERPFTHNGGGYSTLSFVPTLATMILGLLAGGVMRSDRSPKAKVQWLVVAGVAGLALGSLLGWLGLCPVVKRIWTPSWVLFSGGWCFLILAAFYVAVDVVGLKGLALPLVVIGMNSITAYCLDWLCGGFIRSALKRHLGADFGAVLGPAYAPLVEGAAVLAVMWLILFWLYRRRIFLRI